MSERSIRERRVIQYVNDWHDGLMPVGIFLEDIPRRIAENVTAYFNVPTTHPFIALYSACVRVLLSAGLLWLYRNEGRVVDGTMYFDYYVSTDGAIDTLERLDAKDVSEDYWSGR